MKVTGRTYKECITCELDLREEDNKHSILTYINQDIVNPIATILSVAMLFQHTFNRLDIYNHILSSVKLVLKDNKLTKDLSNNDNYISTSDMGNFIVEKLKGTYGK